MSIKSILFFTLFVAGSLILISATIDLDNLLNYENQEVPDYITKDNTIENSITDAGATLGRVLFYDKKLSLHNTISCASCHLQEFAFGDTARVSVGINGVTTGRHAMRLVNARFGGEQSFFWDERAATLEVQSTQPIQDHIEMGFSGTNGQPDIDSLFSKLENVEYYNYLFEFVFGDTAITEERLQIALAQFIRSIQSFDSRYDTGRAQVSNNIQAFPNFTPAENMGKSTFTTVPDFDQNGIRISGGAGCQRCHRAPEFDISPFAGNNGVIQIVDGEGLDITNTRSPTLRDLFNTQGQLHGPLMHNGNFTTLEAVLDHYDAIPDHPLNSNLDPRLRPSATTQTLNLSVDEKANLIAFLRTLTGSDIYTNEKWSDPFDENGLLTLIGGSVVSTQHLQEFTSINIYPNPASNYLHLSGITMGMHITIFNQLGQQLMSQQAPSENERISLDYLSPGVYFLYVQDAEQKGIQYAQKIILSR